jgi:hypothetical protein
MLFLLSGHPEICYQVWLLLLVLIWGYHFNSWIYHSLLSLPRKFKTSFPHIAMAHMWDLATILILYTTLSFFLLFTGESVNACCLLTDIIHCTVHCLLIAVSHVLLREKHFDWIFSFYLSHDWVLMHFTTDCLPRL